MKALSEADKIRAAFKASEGIVEHSFDQRVVDACKQNMDDMMQRLISGETTFEEEDAVMMMKWRASKALSLKDE
jgi:hypothetical protein